MNAKYACALVVSASLSLLAAAVRAEEFPSVERAMAGFATNTIAAQERAYGYVLGKSRAMNGHNARSVLAALRTMSARLKRDAECDEVCRTGIALGTEPVRFACAATLLQSPSLATNAVGLVACVEQMARDSDAAFADHRIELFKMIADVRMRKLSDVASAIRGLDDAIAWTKDDGVSARLLRLKKIELLRTAKMDEAVEREAQLILRDADCPQQPFLAASYALVDLAVGRKDVMAAGEVKSARHQ